MFGAEAEADHAGGDAAEDGEELEKFEEEGKFAERSVAAEGGVDEMFVSEDLKALGHAGRKFAAVLDFFEIFVDGGDARRGASGSEQ